MAERGLQESIMFVPPARAAGVGGNIRQVPNVFTVTGTSTAAIATGVGSLAGQGGVSFVTVAVSVAVRICFGLAAVGAATQSDMLLPAGVYSFACRGGVETHFRVIKATGESDGVGSSYLSSP